MGVQEKPSGSYGSDAVWAIVVTMVVCQPVMVAHLLSAIVAASIPIGIVWALVSIVIDEARVTDDAVGSRNPGPYRAPDDKARAAQLADEQARAASEESLVAYERSLVPRPLLPPYGRPLIAFGAIVGAAMGVFSLNAAPPEPVFEPAAEPVLERAARDECRALLFLVYDAADRPVGFAVVPRRALHHDYQRAICR